MTSTILVTPVVGLAVASASIIAGQLASALVVDHFGWAGFTQRPANWVRVLGAAYVTLVIVASPVIGASLASAAIIAGQMVMSLLLDEFGLFGLAAHGVTPLRLLGLAILAAGVWAVQWNYEL